MIDFCEDGRVFYSTWSVAKCTWRVEWTEMERRNYTIFEIQAKKEVLLVYFSCRLMINHLILWHFYLKYFFTDKSEEMDPIKLEIYYKNLQTCQILVSNLWIYKLTFLLVMTRPPKYCKYLWVIKVKQRLWLQSSWITPIFKIDRIC